jgi:hypothetical protein
VLEQIVGFARRRVWLVFYLLITAAAEAGPLADDLCAVIGARVTAIAGEGPVFLASWEETDEPALKGAAFTYDNALAAIVLWACGRRDEAKRIGTALRLAATEDRAGHLGRLRNVYRAGAQTERPLPPMGWWQANQGRWVEDDYSVGTATGNVAWAALALLTLNETEAARRLADWIESHTRDTQGPGGFTGGIFGDGADGQHLTWKSTEHNVDALALFMWLGRSASATQARHFLDAMWDKSGGRFFIGTAPDGVSINTASSGLDAQLWPLLLRDSPSDWRRTLDFAKAAHGVAGGFDFSNDRDGLWVEGTAQAALAFKAVGRPRDADRLLRQIAQQKSPGGLLYATREARITTGLALTPASPTDDFYYYRRPHLGATAWAILADLGWNPLTGMRVP